MNQLFCACLLAAIIGCAAACSNESPSQSTGMVRPLRVGISLRDGQGSGKTASRSVVPNATDVADNRVKSLRVLAFEHETGLLADNRKVDVSDMETNPAVTLNLYEGNYDFVAVCNETPALAALLDVVVNRPDLDRLSFASGACGSNLLIPMAGETKNASVTQAGVTDVDGVEAWRLTIVVERLAACLNLTVQTRIPDGVPGTSELGKLTRLQLSGFPQHIALMPGRSAAYNRVGEGETRALVDTDFTDIPIDTETNPDTGAPALPEYLTRQSATRVIVPSWLFTPATDADKAVKVQATFTNKQTLDGVLSYTQGGTKYYTLSPNAKYTVTVTGTPEGLETVITTGVLPWEDETQNGGM